MINDNKAYAAFFNVLLVFLVLACLIPFWLLIASSFTSETTLVQNGYSLFPQEWNTGAYDYLWTTRGSDRKSVV